MARIPDEQIQRLKDEVSVQRLVEAAGVELKRTGKDWAGRCPFHEDGTASLIVTPAKNLWHCFGCQCGGGPIDWVMKQRGVSFRHAVELLKEDAAISCLAADAHAPQHTPKHSGVRALSAPVAFDASGRELLGQVVEYYHQCLKDSPQAQAYLAGRGLTYPELIDHFKLGYANRTLGLRLPVKQLAAGGRIRAQLMALGIYRASGHEHFNGSLIVPILDSAGDVHEIYGRKITSALRAGTPLHLYLPAQAGRGRGVFNEAALIASREIILCEALIDALTFWSAGYRNVTAAYGVEGFTGEMLAAFKRHGTERVLIAYDRDEAGERAAAKLGERLMGQGIECFRILFPKGMDANAYALKVQPAAKSLGLLIRQAQWMGKGKTAPAVSTAEAAPALAAEISSAPEPLSEPLSDPLPQSSAKPVEPLPASPMPQAAQEPLIEIVPGQRGQEVHILFGQTSGAPDPHAMPPAGVRAWRVRGIDKNLAPDLLKINLRIAIATQEGGAFHVDTLDLYNARQRAHFVAQAQAETGLPENILKADIGRVLMALEGVQDQVMAAALAPKTPAAMSQEDETAALALLRDTDLPARILADFQAVGVIGEATNCLAGYLAAVSRKLERPLAIVIQSSSAAGKSSLMEAVLAFMPEDQRIQYSAMTGQSLFYMGQSNLQHKILAIAEEEGAHRAAYALKLLQSEGELTIASTGADPHTGNLITQQYKVQGPVSLFMTTTAIDIDEELLNRCLVLSVNEAREQTRAIHRLQRQRRTLAGLTGQHHRQAVLAVHRNAQRLLRPLAVVNPWAERLTFLDERTRTRRDHDKYLTLIDAIALLHQYQRPIQSADIDGQSLEYIEATLSDIALANRIAHEVLGRSLDELPPQTRRVLADIQAWVQAQMAQRSLPRQDIRFGRAQVRAVTAISDTQARIHLERLVQLEYLLVHHGKRGLCFEYELLHDGDMHDQRPHLPGLIDPQLLREQAASTPTTPSSRGDAPQLAGPARVQNAPSAAGSPNLQTAANPHPSRPIAQISETGGQTRFIGPMPLAVVAQPPYPKATSLAA